MGDAEWSVAAMDFPPATALLVSAPAQSAGPFSYGFTITNPSSGPLDLVLQIIESTETIPGLGFTQVESNSSAWRPARQESLDSYPLPYENAYALVARISRQVPDEKAIYRDIALPAGEYRVYLRCAVRGGGQNTDGAYARVAIGPRDGPASLIGVVAPADDLPESGWRWVEAGTFAATGDEQRMTITALNQDNLPQAYFRLDRVVILPVSSPEDSRTLEAGRFPVRLAPGETRAFQRASDMEGRPRKRIDIETYDADRRAFRSIHFTVRNAP